MYLSEVLQDIEFEDKINPESEESLIAVYDIDGEEISGRQALSELIAQTIEKGYKINIINLNKSEKKADLTTGPDIYLNITYKTRIINSLASKYNFITKDVSLTSLETWESYLKPLIFETIIDNPTAMENLTSFDTEEYIPQFKKKNKDSTVTAYKYSFYEQEKPNWRDPGRLKKVEFNNGYLIVELDMPAEEVPDVPDQI